MRFDWWTLLLQIVNFLILVWLLWRFLYKPVQAVIAKRKEMAGAALADATAKRSAAEAEKARLEKARAELEEKRQAVIEAARQDAEVRRKAILDHAKLQADALLADARVAAAKEREASIASLKEELAGTAVAIARTILQRTAQESLDAVFRGRILQELDALAQEKKAMPPDADAGPLRVTTAAPLEEAETRAWSEALKARFSGPKVEFATDAGLVAGAELQLPHATVRFTWADELKQAGRLLTASEAE